MSQNTSPDQMNDLAAVEDAKIRDTSQKSYSQGQLVRRRFFRHVPAMVSLVFFTAMVVLAFSSMGLGPIPGWWTEPYRLQPGAALVNGGQPTMFQEGQILGAHPFGQDSLPRDYFARVMRGLQNSIIIALVSGIVGSVIGIFVGAVAGYFRGWIEAVLMRITDFVIVLPLLLVAAILGRMVQQLPGGVFPLAVVIGAVTWTGMARLVRAEVLSLREKEYVAAAIAMGASPWRIILKHMLPNSIGVIIVNASFAIAASILLESTLSYLGMGVREPDVSLGMLIDQNESSMNTRPFLFYIPGLFLILVTLSVNFIGDGLRDAFDPRAQRTGDRRPSLLSALGFRSPGQRREQEASERRISGGPGGAQNPPGVQDPKTNPLQFWRKK